MFGNYDLVKQAVESGTAPDLSTTQTPFLFGFVSFAVLGALRLETCAPGTPMRHLDVISYLIDSGASPEIPDISGANVNAQNQFGEIPLFFSLQGGAAQIVDILMEHGADLDIADANGDSPRKMCVIYGPEVTAVIQRWERKRKGEEAPWEEKRCENCKTKGSGLKQCARCHVVRYCSTECQRAHWKTHKPACNPFCAATTVTLKPTYGGPLASSTVSKADLTRQMLGIATPTASPVRPGLTKNEAENKSMVIKIQVPVDLFTNSPIQSALGGLFIYNKKRDFVCTVTRASNPTAYDAIVQIVRSRGVGGAKAYFAAELKNPDELVVKTSEVLAEQPF
ncbi:hypothetical protein JVT61DRAFT_14707 [Boletus reticuloceps]|uniref:MYND-type domain-containing protein n=1 Tax=Boletus reticuloceps TaxID=495285 RepID=A0A8I3AAE3_9AGAM|nr:hypothetical protein JVT61DRAFT_14707 [Boletus reticuloceps]